jgi:multicomponent Na+:H+ antiporter subunit E
MGRGIALTILLGLLWLGLSGHYTTLILSFGAASVALCVLIAWRMGIVDEEGTPSHLGVRIIGYWIWLAKEIVKTNLHMAGVILRADMPINPRILRFPSTQTTDLGRVIFANSITLTPGTTSIEIEDESVLVHAVTDLVADLDGAKEMDRRVTAVEQKTRTAG